MRKCNDEIYQLVISVHIYLYTIKYEVQDYEFRHDNWSRDYFSNQITVADESCRSTEISVNLIMIIVFLHTYSYFRYILASFWYCCATL